MIKINNNFYMTIAVALSIGIFFVAGQISGTLNSTGLHGIAHIAAYSFLGACYAKGLPRSPMVTVTLLTAGIGGLHELYEVGRYGIGLELHDLFYDIVGAFAGALGCDQGKVKLSRWDDFPNGQARRACRTEL
jgi:hypothetical protein